MGGNRANYLLSNLGGPVQTHKIDRSFFCRKNNVIRKICKEIHVFGGICKRNNEFGNTTAVQLLLSVLLKTMHSEAKPICLMKDYSQLNKRGHNYHSDSKL